MASVSRKWKIEIPVVKRDMVKGRESYDGYLRAYIGVYARQGCRMKTADANGWWTRRINKTPVDVYRCVQGYASKGWRTIQRWYIVTVYVQNRQGETTKSKITRTTGLEFSRHQVAVFKWTFLYFQRPEYYLTAPTFDMNLFRAEKFGQKTLFVRTLLLFSIFIIIIFFSSLSSFLFPRG